MKRFFFYLTIIAMSVFFITCSKDSSTNPIPNPPDTITYTVSLPSGKLPWPHHKPSINQNEYDKLMNDLFIINNFGQYQSGTTIQSAYFHDGLDVVLPNGTKIYSIRSGYVKAIINTGSEYYQSIIIGETQGTDPGDAWAYTHVFNFQFKVGDFVPRGSFIAEIHFQGVTHVHLNRGYLTSGSWNDWSNFKSIQPDTFFVYNDTQPPVIEKPFYFFMNNTDNMFIEGNPRVVSGDVDIVTGIREAGDYANSKNGVPGFSTTDFGDRLCISRIEYEISGEKIQTIKKKSFDFSKIIFKYSSTGYLQVLTVYKFYTTVHSSFPTWWSQVFSYYIITNADGSGEFGEIKTSDQDYAWNTAEKNQDGSPKFPNGKYTIKVTAYDFKGNSATESEVVEVKN